MEEKKCFKCNQVKPLIYFYKHTGMKDGHLNKCKTCTRDDSVKRKERKSKDPKWVEAERERQRVKTLNYCPIKKKAHNASKSLKNDHPKDSELHHWSYRQEHWKDIFPLNKKDHMKIHRYTKYDPDVLQYRTVHGTLLDSRELCEKYYNIVLSLKDGEYSELQKLF